jgi:hypothetical protein
LNHHKWLIFDSFRTPSFMTAFHVFVLYSSGASMPQLEALSLTDLEHLDGNLTETDLDGGVTDNFITDVEGAPESFMIASKQSFKKRSPPARTKLKGSGRGTKKCSQAEPKEEVHDGDKRTCSWCSHPEGEYYHKQPANFLRIQKNRCRMAYSCFVCVNDWLVEFLSIVFRLFNNLILISNLILNDNQI